MESRKKLRNSQRGTRSCQGAGSMLEPSHCALDIVGCLFCGGSGLEYFRALGRALPLAQSTTRTLDGASQIALAGAGHSGY